jgi:hypothetical protein
VTDTLYHTSRKIRGEGTSHSFLVDIGEEIEIHGVCEGEPLRGGLVFADPFYQKTRYFEIVIDVPEGDPGDSVENITVYPVRARKKRDLRILGFPVLKGRWVITERPESMRYGIPAVQWIYTDDFCLLHLTSGSNSVDAMADLVITKIDEIASSIRYGNRVRSHIENEASYRESVKTLLSNPSREGPGITGNLSEAISQGLQFPQTPGRGTGITAAPIAIADETLLNLRLSEIDEINDMSWMFE